MIVTMTSCAPVRALRLAGDPADRRAADEAAEDADDHVHEERQAQAVAEPGGHDGAADELALAADVEQARLVRQRDGETGEDQRRRADRRLRQRHEHGRQNPMRCVCHRETRLPTRRHKSDDSNWKDFCR